MRWKNRRGGCRRGLFYTVSQLLDGGGQDDDDDVDDDTFSNSRRSTTTTTAGRCGPSLLLLRVP